MKKIHADQKSRQSAMRDRRKALGLCIECGKNSAFSRCSDCSRRVSERRKVLNGIRASKSNKLD